MKPSPERNFYRVSVTRGKFLRQLGRSLPGMILGSGVAAAAHKVLGKMTAAAETGAVNPAKRVAEPLPAVASDEKIEFINQGPTMGNRIALTFDDGPTPGVTDRILDELQRRGLHATFFMIGERLLDAPDLARRVLAEGHAVGHHTFTHANLTTLPDTKVSEEVEKSLGAMREILGIQPRWFRPPFGALRRNQAPLIARHGMRIVFWNVDPKDWSRPGTEKIGDTILEGAAAGSIVLCHDVHDQTAEALPRVIDGLHERGLAPVTLRDLLE